MEKPVYKNKEITEYVVVIEGRDIIFKNSEEKARIVFDNVNSDYDVYILKDKIENSKLPKFVNYDGDWFIN